MSVKITEVENGSLADAAGIKQGDVLISINGNKINDVLDYQFYAADEKLKIQLERGTIKLRKDEYEDLGLEFSTYLMDEKRRCHNNCIFCFINQLPKGMRETLYFKDDDARLSFLQGNYITMTNLTEDEVNRIIKMKLKVNISVHTTNPELRCMMTNNKNAGKALDYLYKMAKAGLELNCQLVMCPGINDGDELRRTMNDLTALYPSVTSIACVPIGLTKYRDGLMQIPPFNKQTAADVIDIIEEYGDKMYEKYGDRVCFPADEFFLLAERKMPDYDYYGDFEQYENGVGMWVSLEKEFDDALCDRKENLFNPSARNKSIATGKLASPLMKSLADKLNKQYPQVNVNVYQIDNDFFGHSITVAGLLTGGDIIKQLTGKELGDELIIPNTMLRMNTEVFLDDRTVDDLRNELNVKVTPVCVDGWELLDAILR